MSKTIINSEIIEEMDVVSLKNILNKSLCIPNYQRPYLWDKIQVKNLINDIKENSERGYSIGTIILHHNKDRYDIVDGQQRIITLILLKKALGLKNSNKLFEKYNFSLESQVCIKKNYLYIKECVKIDSSKLKAAFNNDKLNFTLIVINNVKYAFSFFDSQIYGKPLESYDIQYAYHIRKMKNEKVDKIEDKISFWNDLEECKIDNLFKYLYYIYHWSLKEKCIFRNLKMEDSFNIYLKGIGEDYKSDINYIPNRNYFLINKPFYAGEDFFRMIKQFSEELLKINEEKIDKYILSKEWLKILYKVTMLFYNNKFKTDGSEFITSWIKQLDLYMYQFKTIEKYAIGEYSENYEGIYLYPIFQIIDRASTPNEIINLELKSGEKHE